MTYNLTAAWTELVCVMMLEPRLLSAIMCLTKSNDQNILRFHLACGTQVIFAINGPTANSSILPEDVLATEERREREMILFQLN